MGTHKNDPKYKQPFYIRRVIYIVVAVAALIANYFFGISTTLTNTWYPNVELLIDFLAPFLLIYAATKANAGSDADLTEEDLTEAQQNILDAKSRVEQAKETESRLDDVTSQLQLGMVTITELIREFQNTTPVTNITHVHQTDEGEHKPADVTPPPVELSLDALRERMSG